MTGHVAYHPPINRTNGYGQQHDDGSGNAPGFANGSPSLVLQFLLHDKLAVASKLEANNFSPPRCSGPVRALAPLT